MWPAPKPGLQGRTCLALSRSEGAASAWPGALAPGSGLFQGKSPVGAMEEPWRRGAVAPSARPFHRPFGAQLGIRHRFRGHRGHLRFAPTDAPGQMLWAPFGAQQQTAGGDNAKHVHKAGPAPRLPAGPMPVNGHQPGDAGGRAAQTSASPKGVSKGTGTSSAPPADLSSVPLAACPAKLQAKREAGRGGKNCKTAGTNPWELRLYSGSAEGVR